MIRVYPRVCGGTSDTAIQQIRDQGLSPRVRGNPARRDCRPDPIWSIPACAGEPVHSRPQLLLAEVYPRVCGGTDGVTDSIQELQGLSPRVRGNPDRYRHHPKKARSIPACAGEPTRGFSRLLVAKVYPRVCGGTAGYACQHDGVGGLSPRVRGNPGRAGVPGPPYWSIPACAGEPMRAWRRQTISTVYPRVCGRTAWLAGDAAAKSGLSPRVRGNQVARIAPAANVGSIPACAGEPPIPRGITRAQEVYPRVCGGT